MSTLYEIREDLEALAEILYEVGGDITEAEAEAAIDAWLAETEGAMREKVDRYAAFIRELEGKAAMRKAEAERLTALAQTDANTAKRLKDRLHWFFDSQEITALETDRFKLKVANNGGSVPVVVKVAPEDLPEEFRVATYRADTIAIRNALAKAPLPFAEFGERGRHLRIR